MSEPEVDDTLQRMSEGMPEDMPPPVDPAIAAMLAANGYTKEPPKTGVLNLDPSTAAELRGADEHEQERVEVPPPAQWQLGDPDKPIEDEPWALWRRDMGNLGPVDVTEAERRLFLKAAFNDQEVEFEIDLKGAPDFPVRVRSLSNRMLRAISMALGKDGEAGLFYDLSVWASRLQYYSVILQYRGCGDVNEPLLPETVGDKPTDKLPIGQLCDWLRGNADEILADVSGPRYLLIVQAIRVFEAKLSRCKEGLINGDFSDTADTPS